MRTKKLVAILAAATMLLGAVPVSAANTATGSSTASGEGSVIKYDTTPVYEVTLPTGKALDFTVDPHGLMNLASGSSVALASMSATNDIYTATGVGAVITNKSSEAIVVDVEISLVNTVTGAAAATFVASEGALDVENPAIWLTMVPSSNKAATVTGASFGTNTAVTLSEKTNTAFYLGKADYQMTNVNGVIKLTYNTTNAATNYTGTVFKLAGKTNNSADWKKYENGGLGINAVFSYKTYESETAPQIVTGTYALVAGKEVDALAALIDGTLYIALSETEGFPNITTGAALTLDGRTCGYNLLENGMLTLSMEHLLAGLGISDASQLQAGTYTFKLKVGDITYVADWVLTL